MVLQFGIAKFFILQQVVAAPTPWRQALLLSWVASNCNDRFSSVGGPFNCRLCNGF